MSTVEERLSALESEVEAVKHLLSLSALSESEARTSRRRSGDTGKPRAWLDEVAGSMEEWPEFEEVLRLGRAFRESLRDAPDTGTAEG